MVNYAAEIDAIFAEHSRRSAVHSQDLAELEQRTAAAAYALEVRATAEMKEFWEEHAEEFERARAEAEEKERREMEAREQRDAEARAAAELRARQGGPMGDVPVRRANEPAVQQHYEAPQQYRDPAVPLTEAERLEAEAREQRAAIARAAAFRKANNVVRASDDEDEDDEYYRRKSWLV
ncbi:hypothetical protein [Nocardia macrotermitis]|uniref:Uncharacterized protein n=1 Tax=Nocardia macrotermitis TaxID=2585198 RepID=A0A7K0CZZ2_9NOCA|nr:hypothetical protein [Nocardia macrotermitis]MQY19045.1 hypothetical protein [Nocardia macrotermitis]